MQICGEFGFYYNSKHSKRWRKLLRFGQDLELGRSRKSLPSCLFLVVKVMPYWGGGTHDEEWPDLRTNRPPEHALLRVYVYHSTCVNLRACFC